MKVVPIGRREIFLKKIKIPGDLIVILTLKINVNSKFIFTITSIYIYKYYIYLLHYGTHLIIVESILLY